MITLYVLYAEVNVHSFYHVTVLECFRLSCVKKMKPQKNWTYSSDFVPVCSFPQ